ncbi:MAG: site-specific integrase [Bacteroidales bacterium]|nr:site-specific integrase [Bacteroidales bacterium]
MKRKLSKTKCTVKLRKVEFKEEWYLILESYPVIENGKAKRKIESLNRIIKTPIWDKKHIAKTAQDGTITYQPKRDLNGIIQCRSTLDQESCIYAEGARQVRQKEFDNYDLYSDGEKTLAEKKELLSQDFITYFDKLTYDLHKHSSDSIIVNWKRVGTLLRMFSEENPISFSEICRNKTIEEFKRFLLDAPCGGGKRGKISKNTASTYFSIFKAALRQAFVEEYIDVDVSSRIKGIVPEEKRREHLTIEELNSLAKTETDHEVMKRAALFSALTGLRHCDIQNLKWKNIESSNGKYTLNFIQQKTKGVEYMPISEQAYQLCGTPDLPEKYIFEDLEDAAWISKPLEKWIKDAGIQKKITFHCFRHTYATLQLANGTDIYTVSKMLGHKKIETTQIYTKVVDTKKDATTKAININL